MFGKVKINDPYNTMGAPAGGKPYGRLVKKFDLTPEKPAPKTRTCPECKGECLVRRLHTPTKKLRGMGGGEYTTYIDCPSCEGTGQVSA
jgi:DnaJ-class molecular chaperone